MLPATTHVPYGPGGDAMLFPFDEGLLLGSFRIVALSSAGLCFLIFISMVVVWLAKPSDSVMTRSGLLLGSQLGLASMYTAMVVRRPVCVFSCVRTDVGPLYAPL